MLAALIGVAVLSFVLAAHPFGTYPLSLALGRRFHRRAPYPPARRSRTTTPRLALCFCAYREAGVIEQKVANLREIRRRIPDIQIFGFVDGSSDGTDAILERHRDLINLTISSERRGKTFGMNTLVAQTDAEILIFTDANVMIDPDGLDRMLDYFADPEIGCVAGHLIYINSEETATSQNGALYWRLEEATKRLESETGSTVGADGSLFAIRRELHSPVPDGGFDDLYVSMDILCQGYRVVSAPDVRCFERTATEPMDEFRRKIRIACEGFNVTRLMWPRLAKLPAFTLYKYLSHRVLRWFSIYLLGLSGLAWLGVLLMLLGWASVLALCAGGLVVATIGWRLRIGPVRRVVDILVAMTGVGIGVARSIRGDRFVMWAPATSVRETGPSTGI
ncbi:MAG TPA: glycosyltransferase [Candidatus Sulfotelmatobacter sp.]|nr:glycosyltransferase [Candidatus Sulfotelmatobacter sp.]